MWKVKSVKETYTTLAGEELETFSEDEEMNISFESRLEAIIYVANLRNTSPWSEEFGIYYHEDFVEINVYGHNWERRGYWYYHIEKM